MVIVEPAFDADGGTSPVLNRGPRNGFSRFPTMVAIGQFERDSGIKPETNPVL